MTSNAWKSAAPNNFIEAALSGRATLDEIDDYIAAWHDAPDNSPAAAQEVYEFLGMTWEEYKLWGERPESLRFTLAARRFHKPVRSILQSEVSMRAAARSKDSDAASRVLEWLDAHGSAPAPFHGTKCE